MTELQKCTLCDNVEDPRWSVFLHLGDTPIRYPLCDGCAPEPGDAADMASVDAAIRAVEIAASARRAALVAPAPSGGGETTLEDLLALDLLGEAMALKEQLPSLDGLARLEGLGEKFSIVPIASLQRLHRYLQALSLATCQRVTRDEEREDFAVTSPFMLRAVVRREDVGPLVFDSGSLRILDTQGRCHLFRCRAILLPGQVHRVEPKDAILLGYRISPTDAMAWYARGLMRDAWTPP